MKVRELINKLLNYNMDVPVELVILGEDGERYASYLPDNSIDEDGGFDDCSILLNSTEIKDDDESIEDLFSYKYKLINFLEKKGKK